jgi:hypothetical protein
MKVKTDPDDYFTFKDKAKQAKIRQSLYRARVLQEVEAPRAGVKVNPTHRSPLLPRKYLFLLEAESTPGP